MKKMLMIMAIIVGLSAVAFAADVTYFTDAQGVGAFTGTFYKFPNEGNTIYKECSKTIEEKSDVIVVTIYVVPFESGQLRVTNQALNTFVR